MSDYKYSDYLGDIKKKFLNLKGNNIQEVTEDIETFWEQIRKKLPKMPGIKPVLSDVIPQAPTSKKKVVDDFVDIYRRIPDWNSPYTAYNVIPSPLLPLVSINAITNLFNPNAITDALSGGFVDCEKAIIKYLSELVGINKTKSLGVSTFGGKGTLLYPLKIGLNKAIPDAVENGIKEEVCILTGETNHYSISDVCNFLGIGTKNCVKVVSKSMGIMDIDDFSFKLEECVRQGKKIAGIIVSGGETIYHGMDDVQKIVTIRDRVCEKYKLPYRPHVHVDSVNGWVWLFYRTYNFKINPLNLNKSISKAVQSKLKVIKNIKYADSFSADFHKTGLCPYTSAFFVAKDKKDLLNISGDFGNAKKAGLLGDEPPCNYTLEHSRSCTGIASAYFAIRYMGYEGFQRYLAYLLNVGFYIRKLVTSKYSDYLKLLNEDSDWHTIVFMPKFFGLSEGVDGLINASPEVKSKYNKLCMSFMAKCNEAIAQGKKAPYLGPILDYMEEGKGTGLCAFKIYPMSVHMSKSNCKKLLDSIIRFMKEVHIGEEEELSLLTKSDLHILK